MRSFIHPLVRRQMLAPQPPWYLPLLLLEATNWLLTLCSAGLRKFQFYAVLRDSHSHGYIIVFASLQIAMALACAAFLSLRYPSSLWRPQPRQWNRILLSGLILAPVLFCNLWPFLSRLTSFIQASKMLGQPQFAPFLRDLHQKAWSALPHGPSLAGVIFSSLDTFVAPVLEEVVFSGCLANVLAKKMGGLFAIFVTGACFALVHIPAFGFGSHLILLFWAGATYATVRFVSGSLVCSVLSHWLVNLAVMFPKWWVAWLYFGSV